MLIVSFLPCQVNFWIDYYAVFTSGCRAILQDVHYQSFWKNRQFLYILYIEHKRFYTSGPQNSEKQSNCVNRYLIAFEHVGCFRTPLKHRCISQNKVFKSFPKLVYSTLNRKENTLKRGSKSYEISKNIVVSEHPTCQSRVNKVKDT